MRRRTIYLVLFLGTLFSLSLLIGFYKWNTANALTQQSSEAYVIVQFNSSERIVRKIEFIEPTISGLKALEMSGLEVGIAETSYGKAVCHIEGVGCPIDDCFCDGNNFWNYGYWDGTAWQVYMVGADQSVVSNNAVEGWRWGEWNGQPIPPATPITKTVAALDWLRTQQSPADGGYGTRSSSAETLLTIGANRMKAADWRASLQHPSLMDYWLSNEAQYANSGAAESGKLAVGLKAAQGCWAANALTPWDYYDPQTGIFAKDSSGFQAWAMLGALSFGQDVPEPAREYLKSLVQPDGGWEWMVGFTSDTNTTALAIQALIATGEPVTSTVIVDGLNFLKSAQNADGGFPYDPDSPWGTQSDTDSTALVIQAIVAAGQDPSTDPWVIHQTNPIEFLLNRQLADGSFEWQSGYGSNVLATQQAIPALLGNPYPFRAGTLSTCETGYLPVIRKDSP
jgi:hypothetical protein